MSLFEERERAFELMFAYDEEMRFRALARRNRLFASWAAERLGLRNEERDDYVTSMVDRMVLPEGEEELVACVCDDFAARGVSDSEASVRLAMARARETAARQVKEQAFEAPLVVAR